MPVSVRPVSELDQDIDKEVTRCNINFCNKAIGAESIFPSEETTPHLPAFESHRIFKNLKKRK